MTFPYMFHHVPHVSAEETCFQYPVISSHIESSLCLPVGSSSGSHLDHRHSPGHLQMSQVITKRHDVPRCGTTELLQCISIYLFMSQAIFQQWPEFLMSLQREAEITDLVIGCIGCTADLLTRVTPSGRARCVNSPGCSRCTGVPVCIASVSDKTKAKGADNIYIYNKLLFGPVGKHQFGSIWI